MITETLGELLSKALKDISLASSEVVFEHPGDSSHGDYATNIALVLGKERKENPREIAQMLVNRMNESKPDLVEKIEVAGPGFINFYLAPSFFSENLGKILSDASSWGRNNLMEGKKAMVEYTDPNPFKEFHIGHLMTNTIGEALSRLIDFSGAEVKRANYQGDLGLHVAKAVWAMREFKPRMPSDEATLGDKAKFLGECYVHGATQFEDNPEAARAIKEINALLYSRGDKELNVLYEIGKRWSLERFEEIYKVLGTKFDFYFFESETAVVGLELVEEGLSKGVFEESEGAIVFKGEKYGLHTRVFKTSQGLPTYETKELGLAKTKYEKYPFDVSVTVTANEINEYFEVVRKAMSFVIPEIAEKITHVGHGFMRLSEGKMSSRKGNIITGESLISDMVSQVEERMKDRPEFTPEQKSLVSTQVAVSAIKYSILKQAAGRDIVFDMERALSLEGDSGPYLQYATVRANSVLAKAHEGGITPEAEGHLESAKNITRLLSRFPEIVSESIKTSAPHHVAQYLTQLAGEFNAWYAKEQIVDGGSEEKHKVAVTRAFSQTMTNGLWLLGIEVPEKM